MKSNKNNINYMKNFMIELNKIPAINIITIVDKNIKNT